MEKCAGTPMLGKSVLVPPCSILLNYIGQLKMIKRNRFDTDCQNE